VKVRGCLSLCLGLGLLLSGSCAAPGPEAGAPQLKRHLQACTDRYGYAPETLPPPGERELAPHELAWRSCVYQALRAVATSFTLVPQRYEQLIAEDHALTQQIARGEATRSERRARLEANLEAIEREERAARLAREDRQRRYLYREIELMQDFYGPRQLIPTSTLQRLSR
jgi:hypothetical protein